MYILFQRNCYRSEENLLLYVLVEREKTKQIQNYELIKFTPYDISYTLSRLLQVQIGERLLGIISVKINARDNLPTDFLHQ